MVFNSAVFLLFFARFFPVYWVINNRFSPKIRNLFVLLGSYVFYGYWDWRFLSLILISSAADFYLGKRIDGSEDERQRKLFLWLSLGINLGILGFFKYFNFFLESFQLLLQGIGLESNPYSLGIILPVGISFYTFQTLSYTIDIYRRQLKAVDDPLQFFTFVAFFPQLVAGPIERARNLLPQFEKPKSFDYDHMIWGMRLILYGFFKKVVIADNFAIWVDAIFLPEANPGGLAVLLGALLFGFQIYCDFSAYSDIAIGLAALLGYQLLPNFQTPYFSASFREFWQRWHISLSTWFRDYVYIPLGGNRNGESAWMRNIFLTFLLSGLWHGAGINFLVWGALHALLLIAERKISLRLQGILANLWVFILCILLWLPFRAEGFQHLLELMNQVLHLFEPGQKLREIMALIPVGKAISLGAVFVFFILFEKMIATRDFGDFMKGKKGPFRYSMYYSLMLAILFLGNFEAEPYFIYFQF